jgi:hypothetical protein
VKDLGAYTAAHGIEATAKLIADATLIERPRRAIPGGRFILEWTAAHSAPVWGQDHQVAWASGEPVMVCGPQGVGKTTIAQRIAMARIGAITEPVLGLPVTPSRETLLYIAADRPVQAARSWKRMLRSTPASTSSTSDSSCGRVRCRSTSRRSRSS